MPNTPRPLQDLVIKVQIVAIRPAGSGESGVPFTVVQNVVDLVPSIATRSRNVCLHLRLPSTFHCDNILAEI